jgi:hypothetical protein
VGCVHTFIAGRQVPAYVASAQASESLSNWFCMILAIAVLKSDIGIMTLPSVMASLC